MKKLRIFDVVLVDFGSEMIKGEQCGIRPAVVIQNDIGNIHSSTTIVIPLTTKIKNVSQPTHTLIEKDVDNGLACDSMLLGEAIRAVSKERIRCYLGKIIRDNVKKQIRKALEANFVEVTV